MRMLINVFTLNRFICLHMRLIILTLACKGLLITQWQVSRALCNFGRKKRGVRDDIKYTWSNLKIVWLGIAQTHGWVKLAQTVPTSSSHQSSTVNKQCRHWWNAALCDILIWDFSVCKSTCLGFFRIQRVKGHWSICCLHMQWYQNPMSWLVYGYYWIYTIEYWHKYMQLRIPAAVRAWYFRNQ